MQEWPCDLLQEPWVLVHKLETVSLLCTIADISINPYVFGNKDRKIYLQDDRILTGKCTDLGEECNRNLVMCQELQVTFRSAAHCDEECCELLVCLFEMCGPTALAICRHKADVAKAQAFFVTLTDDRFGNMRHVSERNIVSSRTLLL